MRTSRIAALFHVTLATFFAGCASLETKDITPTLRVLAYTGTWYAVHENPDWRDEFQTAADELQALASAESIDWLTLMVVVSRLPVDELASDEARLAITAGTMLLTSYGGTIQLDQIEKIKPIALALSDGIRMGLQSIAPPPATRAQGVARNYYSPKYPIKTPNAPTRGGSVRPIPNRAQRQAIEAQRQATEEQHRKAIEELRRHPHP